MRCLKPQALENEKHIGGVFSPQSNSSVNLLSHLS